MQRRAAALAPLVTGLRATCPTNRCPRRGTGRTDAGAGRRRRAARRPAWRRALPRSPRPNRRRLRRCRGCWRWWSSAAALAPIASWPRLWPRCATPPAPGLRTPAVQRRRAALNEAVHQFPDDCCRASSASVRPARCDADIAVEPHEPARPPEGEHRSAHQFCDKLFGGEALQRKAEMNAGRRNLSDRGPSATGRRLHERPGAFAASPNARSAGRCTRLPGARGQRSSQACEWNMKGLRWP